MKNNYKTFMMLIGSWAIFAFWGVIARSISIPLPLLLLIICIGGTIFSSFFITRPFNFSYVAVVVAAILVMDLLFLFLAFQRISFATTIAIHYAGPIIVSLLAPVILGEHFSMRGLFMAVIGFIAVIILCNVELKTPNGPDSIYGILFAIASAFTLAGNIIYQRMYMIKQPAYGNAVAQYNMFMIIGYAFLIYLWPYVSGENVFPLRPGSTMFLFFGIVAGLLTQGLAMIMFNSAIRYVDSQTVSRMAFSEVAMTILLGSAIYNEKISHIQIIAIVSIIFVVYFSQRNASLK